ncbi:hypothetical protein [Pseudarthrobacter sp. BRE9]|uniref:hypothetical protein n=1 Tax=Pseudarthrobacter sp. BRE9 TaxID=2962582 RepID=UPI0028810E3B|nr:hypothetical protein [Pseudarthrobacter sp. BRE9]MDT0168502.1 hypothetical protein [Pseudarthrobacter sp. BRE9]
MTKEALTILFVGATGSAGHVTSNGRMEVGLAQACIRDLARNARRRRRRMGFWTRAAGGTRLVGLLLPETSRPPSGTEVKK